jgi:hypothetical protein
MKAIGNIKFFREYHKHEWQGILLILCLISSVISAGNTPALIPLPQKIEWNKGKFTLEGSISVCFNINQDDLTIKEIRDILTFSGVNNWIETKQETLKGKKIVVLLSEKSQSENLDKNENYSLIITSGVVKLEAVTCAGLYHGVQTLKQLVVMQKGNSYIQSCYIDDWPAFSLRGFMQDVGRNYMPLPLLKEQIDVMAAYKFNVFHLHLTDNPGWRLESLKYPQLKEAASMSRWPGKYYSREEFIDLVNYCGQRYITLIPEFDIPGHCEAFRKAFAIDSMADPCVEPILIDLIDELCELVPAGKMPYIHLGTDEVWTKKERPAPGLVKNLMERIRRHHREVIVWRPGQQVEGDLSSINQLWSSNGHPNPGHRYIDSRLNYLNHLDPLAGVAQLYFDRICGASHSDSLRLGGILCCWNDNNVNDSYDILRQNPVYPGILTYSETSWKGQTADTGEEYLAKLPDPENHLFKEFAEFEDRLIRHRDLYFRGKPFPYLLQTNIQWNIIGPFDNGGNVNRKFPVEDTIKESYLVDGKVFSWKGPFYGSTIHINHFFGYPSYFELKEGTAYAASEIWSPGNQETGCWIGFHDWSRSGGRRGGPFPDQGEWLKTNPKVWINKKEIAPPLWNHPGLSEKTEDIPFSDENYYFRETTRITLKKGWNQVLLKIPQDGTSWKWMFTFIPVEKDDKGIHEVKGIKFRTISKISK